MISCSFICIIVLETIVNAISLNTYVVRRFFRLFARNAYLCSDIVTIAILRSTYLSILFCFFLLFTHSCTVCQAHSNTASPQKIGFIYFFLVFLQSKYLVKPFKLFTCTRRWGIFVSSINKNSQKCQ